MRATIIVDDRTVTIEGMATETVDMAGIDESIHAVQWYSTWGEIEYRTDVCAHCGGVSRKPNERITDIAPFQPFIDRWEIEAKKRNGPLASVEPSTGVSVVAD